MTDTPMERDERIAAIRKSIRVLIGQITAHSGAAEDDAETIHDIREKYLLLAGLLKKRETTNPRPGIRPETRSQAS